MKFWPISTWPLTIIRENVLFTTNSFFNEENVFYIYYLGTERRSTSIEFIGEMWFVLKCIFKINKTQNKWRKIICMILLSNPTFITLRICRIEIKEHKLIGLYWPLFTLANIVTNGYGDHVKRVFPNNGMKLQRVIR